VAIELARYIEWILTSSQAEAEAQTHLVAPVSPTVANRIRSEVLERMTCDGQLLMDLVRRQKYEESESLKTWKLPVLVVSPIVTVIILLLTVYAILQRVQYIRTLNRDDWKIDFYEIDFVVPKKRRRGVISTANTHEDVSPSSPGICLGRWNIHEIVARRLSIERIFDVDWKVKRTLMRMREEIGHENVARFFGISSHEDAVYLVEQYCASGTLTEFLRYNKYGVNQSFRYVACAGVANGMAYLHRQNVIHGNLSIDKCYVDSRWTIKIVDWEYTTLYDVVRRTDRSQMRATREKTVLHYLCGEESRAFRHLAPEIQKDGHFSEPTRAGDVYSFGIIVQDVFINVLPPEELPPSSCRICNGMPAKARQIVELACHETAINRPTFQQLEKSIRSAIINGETNLLDWYVYVCSDISISEFIVNIIKYNRTDNACVYIYIYGNDSAREIGNQCFLWLSSKKIVGNSGGKVWGC